MSSDQSFNEPQSIVSRLELLLHSRTLRRRRATVAPSLQNQSALDDFTERRYTGLRSRWFETESQWEWGGVSGEVGNGALYLKRRLWGRWSWDGGGGDGDGGCEEGGFLHVSVFGWQENLDGFSRKIKRERKLRTELLKRAWWVFIVMDEELRFFLLRIYFWPLEIIIE